MTDGGLPVSVPAGALQVAVDGTCLAAIGVGSCVVVALWDGVARVGGLAHPLLPRPVRMAAGEEGRFSSTAVPRLVELMEREGARIENMRAWLAGGASILPELSEPGGLNLGHKNAVAVRAALRHMGVPILAEEVGGVGARSIYLDTRAGSVRVTTTQGGNVFL